MEKLTAEEAEAAVRVGVRRAFGDMFIYRDEKKLDERAEWRKVRAHAHEQVNYWLKEREREES